MYSPVAASQASVAQAAVETRLLEAARIDASAILGRATESLSASTGGARVSEAKQANGARAVSGAGHAAAARVAGEEAELSECSGRLACRDVLEGPAPRNGVRDDRRVHLAPQPLVARNDGLLGRFVERQAARFVQTRVVLGAHADQAALSDA